MEIFRKIQKNKFIEKNLKRYFLLNKTKRNKKKMTNFTNNYQRNKVYRDRWNSKNPIKFREICKRNQRKYDAWKRIQKIFLNILFEN